MTMKKRLDIRSFNNSIVKGIFKLTGELAAGKTANINIEKKIQEAVNDFEAEYEKEFKQNNPEPKKVIKES